jgi:hypothetical protein
MITQSSRSVLNWTNTFDSQAFANSGVVVATPCQLKKLVVTNSKASLLYCFLFDGSSASGTPKIAPIAVPATTTVVVDLSTDWGSHGIDAPAFTSAVFWAASTAAAFSQDSSSSMWLTARYLS